MTPRWEVTLTASEVEWCRSEQEEIGEFYGSHDAPTYTGVNVEHGFFVGRCGELALRKWCDHHGVFYEYGASEHVPDEHDFHLQLDHGPLLSVDVKNSHHERASFLMVPHAQFDKHHHDAYVGCSGYESGDQVVVIIHGIVSRQVLRMRGVLTDRRCPTIEYPLHHLTRLDPKMFQRGRRSA